MESHGAKINGIGGGVGALCIMNVGMIVRPLHQHVAIVLLSLPFVHLWVSAWPLFNASQIPIGFVWLPTLNPPTDLWWGGVWCRTNLVDQMILWKVASKAGGRGKMQPVAASTSMYTSAVDRKWPNFIPAPAWSAWISWTKSHRPLFDVLPKSFKFASLCASQERKNLLFTYFNNVLCILVYSDWAVTH